MNYSKNGLIHGIICAPMWQKQLILQLFCLFIKIQISYIETNLYKIEVCLVKLVFIIEAILDIKMQFIIYENFHFHFLDSLYVILYNT